MKFLRKLDKVDDLLCCDHNDVCEGKVTHAIINDKDKSHEYLCTEHADIVREKLFQS